MPLDVENLSIDQIQAMGPSQVLDALDSCISATCELAREAIQAEMDLAEIEVRWHRQDGHFLTKGEFEAARRLARRDATITKIRNGTIKRIQSAIQSKIRSLP